jgi:peptidoglycan/LPS O-acetylase OafA/YrhL
MHRSRDDVELCQRRKPQCFSGFSALTRTLAEFSLGVLLYRARTRDVDFLRRWAVLLSIECFGAGLLTRQDFLVVGGFTCLTYYGVGTAGVFGGLLNSSPVIALGDWSYAIYLWHAPVHLAAMGIFAASGNPVSKLGLLDARLLALATALTVLGLSGATYQLFEKPVRHLLMAPPAQTTSRPGLP